MELTPPVEPMLARLARQLPLGESLTYEPKWDGFRCLAFRTRSDGDGVDGVDLRSRNQRPLARYFPEVVEAIRALPHSHVVLDGELLVMRGERADFGALMSRLHPSASRVALLAGATPARFVVFDLLALDDEVLLERPFAERRRRLEAVMADAEPPLHLSPSTRDPDVARGWLAAYSGSGIDGVVAKDADWPYEPGRRTMTKVKIEQTADCVVAGFRWLLDRPLVASLLLGLYEDTPEGDALRHIGVVSSFPDPRRQELTRQLAPLAVPLAGHPWEHGFALEGGPMGRLRGSAGRWSPDHRPRSEATGRRRGRTPSARRPNRALLNGGGPPCRGQTGRLRPQRGGPRAETRRVGRHVRRNLPGRHGHARRSRAVAGGDRVPGRGRRAPDVR